MSNIWKNGVLGLVVADALGVPVEFSNRMQRKMDPVTDMREYGTHNQPKGTWSDDSSMMLATLTSIRNKGEIQYRDIMDQFLNWYQYGDCTPFQEVFDIGNATSAALLRYQNGADPLEAGGKSERDNGNGSLMRILPVCLFLYEKQKRVCTSEDESIQAIHNVSALTHGHIRSQIACGFYYFLVKALIEKSGNLKERLQAGMDQSFQYYRRDIRNLSEVMKYSRLMDMDDFSNIPETEIRSSGYVVDTLEAAVWCLLQTSSYKEAVLLAVNLGEDTDTVAAVTGGLAGLFYGFEEIPVDWVNSIQCLDWILNLV